ncbi:multidrug ABC transporter ATP-binding protein [Propionigenium maris DSM 9537]|uniref:Multidrug ABC transporter ATP-binding protein n=1 Tax=Propionigenium maris DSM 9537 TaxID=1123000 RepID=A0A9W6GJC9_9FUSO|nr:ABC transporter ATP-binding protein [Propionigenium maris]GLI55192.1 multidrug ABC transporter ATP-binding protein [Propionigenium maris DSM 9537]
MKKLRYFFGYYTRHKKLFILDFGCAFFMSILDLIFPVFTQRVVDRVLPGGDMGLLLKFCIFLIVLQGVRNILSYIVIYWGHGLGLKIRYDMRNDLFKHLQKLSLSYFDNVKTGEMMSRIMGDLELISELAHHGPEDLFIAIITLVGSFIFMYSVNAKLTLIIFAILIVYLIFALKHNTAMEDAFRRSRVSSAELSSEIEDNLSGIRVVKAFGNQDFINEKFDRKNMDVVTSVLAAFHSLGLLHAGMGMFSGGIQIIILLLGGMMTIGGEMTVGALIGFFLFANRFLEPIRKMLNLLEMYQGGMAGFERFMDILEIDPDIEESPDAIDLERVQGELHFNSVTFSYDGSEDILKDFNLRIAPGESIALVGESGAGKSTICSLIPRFYDVTKGELTIDGVDIRRLRDETLRKNIGIVQQDVFLFNGSIRENIAFGRLDATHEEIREAARRADALEFIEGLENGFDTFVGERGVKLSGGQKQRISIARIFVKNPKVLILDEATSALDNQTEKYIQEALYELTRGSEDRRTTVTIAHRLTTVEGADRILVIGKQGIIEEGSHHELMRVGGVYSSLYNSQKDGFIGD